MGRNIKLPTGEVHFERSASQRLRLKYPTGITGDVTLELPDADGTANQVLQTDGAGKLSFADTITSGGGTTGKIVKFTAGLTVGDSIIEEASDKIGISKTPASAKLEVEQSAANTPLADFDKSGTGTGVTLKLTQAGTGRALDIDMNGIAADAAVFVDSPGDSGTIVQLVKAAGGNGTALFIDQNGNGKSIDIDSEATTSDVVDIAHAGTGHAIHITSTGAGRCIRLDQDGDQIAIDIDSTAATAVPVNIQYSGSGKYIDTNAGAGTPAHLSNSGVWTDASCFRATKVLVEDITPEKEQKWTDAIADMPFARYKEAVHQDMILGPFQDDLCRNFGFGGHRGVAAKEIATLALIACKVLANRVKQLEAPR